MLQPTLTRFDAAKLIRKSLGSILTEWETRCRERVDAATHVTPTALRDSLPSFIEQLAVSLSCADPKAEAATVSAIAQEHAEDRAAQGEYTLDEMIYEYHLLRVVLMVQLGPHGLLDFECSQVLHEAIDRGIRKASVRYVELVDKREAQHLIETDRLREQMLIGVQSSLSNLEAERELREQFVDTLTHDLRTPLTAAKISAQLIDRKAQDPESVRLLALRVVQNIDRGERMIRDLLDTNQIKAGGGIPIRSEDCDLVEVVQEALRDLHLPQGATCRFQTACPILRGSWDAQALRRVIENLVGNAVKYGTPNSPVTITLSDLKHEVELSVHNLGSPISPEEQRSLFSLYRRTDSAIRSGQKGWGIGLTYVKAVVDAHQGKVWVESLDGKGTTFFVRLPKAQELS